MKIAIPTNNPGGLSAARSEHFGHCDIFTVVDVTGENEIADVQLITNAGHGAGGCIEPVNLLKDAGVEAVVVAGLGMRPMNGFNQVGITVYYADQKSIVNVQDVIDSLQNNKLIIMRPDQVCQGSEDCQH